MKRFCYFAFTVLCLAAALFGARGGANAANAADGSVYEPGKEAGERRVVAVDGVEYAFRWAPAATFTIGSPEDEPERDSYETQHSVTLTRGFWILETETTQKIAVEMSRIVTTIRMIFVDRLFPAFIAHSTFRGLPALWV